MLTGKSRWQLLELAGMCRGHAKRARDQAAEYGGERSVSCIELAEQWELLAGEAEELAKERS